MNAYIIQVYLVPSRTEVIMSKCFPAIHRGLHKCGLTSCQLHP